MFHADVVVYLKHAGESQVQVKLNRTFIRGADAIWIRLLKLKKYNAQNVNITVVGVANYSLLLASQ